VILIEMLLTFCLGIMLLLIAIGYTSALLSTPDRRRMLVWHWAFGWMETLWRRRVGAFILSV
jgi:hypothetical protein